MEARPNGGCDAVLSVVKSLTKQSAGLHSPSILPNTPGISVSVDYVGSLPIKAQNNFYILLFTDRSSGRSNMFTVVAAEFTTEGPANSLVNYLVPL